MPTPEELARQNIDRQLTACGWTIAIRPPPSIASRTMSRYLGSKMCSGSCERGNRIAPASGKIGTRKLSGELT